MMYKFSFFFFCRDARERSSFHKKGTARHDKRRLLLRAKAEHCSALRDSGDSVSRRSIRAAEAMGVDDLDEGGEL
jgi:hypothetical protein